MNVRFRVMSPYVPLEEKNSRVFSSFPPVAQENLRQLHKEAASIPRMKTYLSQAGASCSGKYVFLAIEAASGLPIAQVDCLIINMRHLKQVGVMREDYDYGLVLDLVVLPKHRREGVASDLVMELVKRMNDPDVLMASTSSGLSCLRVAMSPHLTSCRRIFEAAGFELERSNGESVYRHRLGNP